MYCCGLVCCLCFWLVLVCWCGWCVGVVVVFSLLNNVRIIGE